MGKSFIGVRDVDDKVYNQFRTVSVERKLKLGEALTQAMMEFIEKNKEKEVKKFLQVKPFSWGEGTENLSEEVDSILYK